MNSRGALKHRLRANSMQAEDDPPRWGTMTFPSWRARTSANSPPLSEVNLRRVRCCFFGQSAPLLEPADASDLNALLAPFPTDDDLLARERPLRKRQE